MANSCPVRARDLFSRFCLSQQNYRDARFGVVLQKRAGDTGFVPGVSPVVVSLLPLANPPKKYRLYCPVPPPSSRRITTGTARSADFHLRLNGRHSLTSSATGKSKQFPLHSP